VIRWIYNLLFNVGLVFAAPFYFLKLQRRGGWRENFGQRWGLYEGVLKQTLTNRRVVWLHAVSVGEVNLCLQLVDALQRRLPHHKLVVSTTTSTGMAELKRRLPGSVTRIYYPIDRRRQVQRALSAIHPRAMVFIESELWPNMIWGLQRRGIPYFLVNARISERSHRRYRKGAFLFRSVFGGFRGIGVQTPEDCTRLESLGVPSKVLHLTGSLKFEAAAPSVKPPMDARALLRQIGVADDALILVAGSTHSGEEVILARIAARLRATFPNLFLILVPRHQERGGEVGKALSEMDVRFVFRSLINPEFRPSTPSPDCLVVNSTGELRSFYGCADVVFIGKSLTSEGGQNPIEPAALGKSVVFGPHMENFAQISALFLRHRGAVQIADETELEKTLQRLLASPSERLELGTRGLAVVRENQGAMNKTVEMIASALDETIPTAPSPEE
jgi:3-deoxy-D-manno-octulosonic-acid transferase